MKPEEKRLVQALCYVLWPVALIVLVVTKKKDDLLFHAWNGLGFAIGALLLWIPIMIVYWISVIGQLASILFWVVVIVFAIRYALDAYANRPVNIPFITDFLKKNIKF